jgi:hypothetical protein
MNRRSGVIQHQTKQQIKWKGRFLNVYYCKHILITLLEDQTLGVQEEDGHNHSFSLRTGPDSVLELA